MAQKSLIERLPPHNVEAEEAVLGSLLIDPDAIYEIVNFLEVKHFFREGNQYIYQAVRDIFDRKGRLDLLTLSDELRRTNRLDDAGGEAGLIGLIDVVPTSVNVKSYAQMVWHAYIRRAVLSAAGKQANLAYDEAIPIEEVTGKAHGLLLEATGQLKTAETMPFKTVMLQTLDEIELRRNAYAEGRLVGFPTGYQPIDDVIISLEKPDLVYLGARPGVGKTALLCNILLRMGKRGIRAALFNLEMKATQLGMRWIAMYSDVAHERLRKGSLDDDEYSRVLTRTGEVGNLPIMICQRWSLTPSALMAECRRIQAQQGLDVVIVDYVQLMRPDTPNPNKNVEVSDISRALKNMAGDLDVVVIAAAQLNRAVEARRIKTPTLADLRDSGSLEQDADDVFFIHRDSEDAVMTNIIIAKQRNGRTGTAELRWSPVTQRFIDPFEVGEAIVL